MYGWLKFSSRVSLLVLLLWCLSGGNPSYSAAYGISRQILDEGGTNWLATSNYRLCSSLGQPVIGTQNGETNNVSTGFWNTQIIIGLSLDVEEQEDLNPLPSELCLHQNYPNPFNSTTTIDYALPRACDVKIRIHNILGQKVRGLIDQRQTAGYKTILWDGKNDHGSEVSTGVYFYRIEAGNLVKCRKMILLK
jgi:hypothetical protein